MSAGYDNIDVAELHRRGIKVGNTPNVLTDAVAEIAIALLLEVARRIPEGRECITQ
jgi:glyoxylate reductase